MRGQQHGTHLDWATRSCLHLAEGTNFDEVTQACKDAKPFRQLFAFLAGGFVVKFANVPHPCEETLRNRGVRERID